MNANHEIVSDLSTIFLIFLNILVIPERARCGIVAFCLSPPQL